MAAGKDAGAAVIGAHVRQVKNQPENRRVKPYVAANGPVSVAADAAVPAELGRL